MQLLHIGYSLHGFGLSTSATWVWLVHAEPRGVWVHLMCRQVIRITCKQDVD